MQMWLVLVAGYATVVQGMLVAVRRLPPACARCGLRVERRRLGEPVCRCRADG